MKAKYYFSKDFQTSDNHDIESLRTRYYRARKEQAIEVIQNIDRFGAQYAAQELPF